MVADHDIHAPALMAADRAVHLPELGDAAYADRLLDAIRLHDIGLLVPTIDTELPILAALAGNRRTGDCRVAVSSTSFVELAADKLATASNFQAAGIAVPDTGVPDEIPDLPAGRRWIVKPRFGSSSIGVLQVETSLVKAAIQIVDRPVIQS